jgi:hypothetical protein
MHTLVAKWLFFFTFFLFRMNFHVEITDLSTFGALWAFHLSVHGRYQRPSGDGSMVKEELTLVDCAIFVVVVYGNNVKLLR